MGKFDDLVERTDKALATDTKCQSQEKEYRLDALDGRALMIIT